MFDPTKPSLTLAELAHRTFADHTELPFLGTKDKLSGTYKYETYGQIALRVRHATGGLMSLGIARGDRCAILAENCAEWAISDLACQMNGSISVPMFSTLPAIQVKGILLDSGASLVFVSNAAQRAKIDAIKADLPNLKYIVVFDPQALESTPDSSGAPSSVEVLSFADLEARGEAHRAANPTDYETTWPAANTNDVATIIYTSGTTGEPKGVMLTHRNLISNLEAIIVAISSSLTLSKEDLFLSFLPLCHIYERTAGYYLPLRLGAAIAYCESLFTVDKNLREVQPTIMFCVPRLYESMREKLFSTASSLPEDKKEKYLDALALGQKAGAAMGHLDGAPGLSLGEKIKYKMYDMAVYSKIREKFGGRLRAFVSGGAPMAPELGTLFTGIGLTILEGYGLTETSPVIAVNRPGRVRLGTVGEIVGSVEARIADDGEILVRGASVMKGYWNKPEETKAALDKDGWFYTGDIGTINDNYLKITDRKKDLLVLGNGKKVAPAPIELRLTESRYISQVVLLGDSQKAVTALIVPNLDAVREYAAQNDGSAGTGAGTDEELLKSPVVLKLIRQEIDTFTSNLADFEKIKKFHLLTHAFTTESGEMTATLKIKRRVVAEKYASLLSE
jgi:long-chain acyl-CoA synthetase